VRTLLGPVLGERVAVTRQDVDTVEAATYAEANVIQVLRDMHATKALNVTYRWLP
jgi:hypothetical protein